MLSKKRCRLVISCYALFPALSCYCWVQHGERNRDQSEFLGAQQNSKKRENVFLVRKLRVHVSIKRQFFFFWKCFPSPFSKLCLSDSSRLSCCVSHSAHSSCKSVESGREFQPAFWCLIKSKKRGVNSCLVSSHNAAVERHLTPSSMYFAQRHMIPSWLAQMKRLYDVSKLWMNS